MFAYCNNNPVSGYDPTGNIPLNVFFSVCYDGAGGKPISGRSDKREMSDDLLKYVSNNCVPFTDATVYIDVQYMGIYTHTEDMIADNIFALFGGLSLLSFVPAVREVAWLSMGLSILGASSSVYGIIGLVPTDSLPEKDYHQYKVTLTWTETRTVTGFSNVFTRTEYYVEMWFLWNDASYTLPYWYIQSSSWEESLTEFRLG